MTGAAGFIGSHTCEELIGAGYKVIGVDNLRTGQIDNLSSMVRKDFVFHHQDCLNFSQMSHLFENYRFTKVLHLAALVSDSESFENPALNFELNVQATDIVARLCGKYKTKKLVFASSAAVYGDPSSRPYPLSPYAVAKLASETLVKGYASCYGFSQTCLRYFDVFGPRQNPTSPYSGVITILINRNKQGKGVTVFGDGEQTRDYVYVKDVAKANRLALESDTDERESIDICTGRPIKLNYLLALLQTYYPTNPLPVYLNEREGYIKHSCGNYAPASERIGFEARVPFEEGISKLI